MLNSLYHYANLGKYCLRSFLHTAHVRSILGLHIDLISFLKVSLYFKYFSVPKFQPTFWLFPVFNYVLIFNCPIVSAYFE